MPVIWTPALDEDAAHWRRVAARLTTERFAPLADAIDREQRYPQEHLAPLLASGISGMFLPRAYGGAGASLTALSAVVETVASGCASTAAILAALSLGTFPVLLGGSEAQKQALLGGWHAMAKP